MTFVVFNIGFSIRSATHGATTSWYLAGDGEWALADYFRRTSLDKYCDTISIFEASGTTFSAFAYGPGHKQESERKRSSNSGNGPILSPLAGKS